jgi:hypothetical protein
VQESALFDAATRESLGQSTFENQKGSMFFQTSNGRTRGTSHAARERDGGGETAERASHWADPFAGKFLEPTNPSSDPKFCGLC